MSAKVSEGTSDLICPVSLIPVSTRHDSRSFFIFCNLELFAKYSTSSFNPHPTPLYPRLTPTTSLAHRLSSSRCPLRDLSTILRGFRERSLQSRAIDGCCSRAFISFFCSNFQHPVPVIRACHASLCSSHPPDARHVVIAGGYWNVGCETAAATEAIRLRPVFITRSALLSLQHSHLSSNALFSKKSQTP